MAHRGYLSIDLIKSHDCINKQCPFYEKLTDEYWLSLERLSVKTRLNRVTKKQEIQDKNDRDIIVKNMLEQSGHIYVTSVREDRLDILTISYIYDRRTDLSQEKFDLQAQLHKRIKLKAKTGEEEVIEQLIRKPRRDTKKVTDLRKAPKVGPVTKKRLAALGVFCIEDLFGRSGRALYFRDCKLSGGKVNRRFIGAYESAVEYAKGLD